MRLRETLRRAAPFLALLVAYLALRAAVYGNFTRVDPRVSVGDFSAYLEGLKDPRYFAALMIAPSNTAAEATTLSVLLLLQAGMLWMSVRAASVLRPVIAFCAIWWVACIAPILPFVSSLAEGRVGARFFYPAAAPLSLMFASPLLLVSTGGVPPVKRILAGAISMALIGWSAIMLRTGLTMWSTAGAEMQAMRTAVAASNLVSPGGYALLLVPDRIGEVPFAAAAQGALLLPPVQAWRLDRSRLPFVPYETSLRLAQIKNGLITRLEHGGLDLAMQPGADLVTWPSTYACWHVGRREFAMLELGIAPNVPLRETQWLEAWRRAARNAGCRDLARDVR